MEEEKRYIEEDEIDLYELWEVLVKRKRLIWGIFFVVVIIALVISFLLPKVYEVRASVMPYKIFSLNNSSITSPQEIAKLFKDKYYLTQVFPEKKIPELEVTLKKNTNIIDIVYDTTKPKEIVEKLKEFFALLAKDGVIIEHAKKALLKTQNDLEVKNNMLSENITLYKQKYSLVETKLKEIETEKSLVQKQLVQLFEKGSMYTGLNPIRVISYGETIKVLQDRAEYLSNKYSYYLSERTKIATTIMNFQSQVKKNNYTLSLIAKDLKNLKLFDILTGPYYMKTPVGPKKKLIVGVAGVSALFLAIFLAFFLEFLERGKKIHNH